MKVVAFEGLDGLRRLEDDWRRLLAETPERAWHLTFEAHHAGLTRMEAPNVRFVALALTGDGVVRAICPLVLRTRRVLGVRTAVWQLPWNGNTLMADVVCPPGPTRHVLLPLVRDHLSRHSEGASWLVVGRVREGSAAWACRDGLRPASFAADVDGRVAILDATISPDEHDARRSKKFRRDLRKAGNRLERLDEVRFETVSGGRPALDEAFATFIELEAAGWKADVSEGTLIDDSEPLRGYYRDLLHELPGAEINTLHAEGRCLAAELCFRSGSDYAIAKIAYNEEYHRMSPGQLLMDHTLKRCCEADGIDAVNLVSFQPWHRNWRAAEVPTWDLYMPLARVGRRLLPSLLRARFRYGPMIKTWLASRAGSG